MGNLFFWYKVTRQQAAGNKQQAASNRQQAGKP
jgi:hypothetical protein